METLLEMINLDRYFRLADKLLPGVSAVCALDINGEFILADEQDKPVFEALNRVFRKAAVSSDEPVYQQTIPGGKQLYLVRLKNIHGAPVGQFVVLIESSTLADNSASLLAIENSLTTITEMIQHEIELYAELNMMSEELTERYEELNLVYDYDPTRVHVDGGEQSLEYLVKNCTGFLNVAMSALILPEQNIAIYDYGQSDVKIDPAIVIPTLNDEIYTWLLGKPETLVINGIGEKIRQQCCASLPYKLIASPIFSDQDHVLGMLCILKHQKEIDFANSDKNLLDVMAKKVNKVMHECFDPMTGLHNARSLQARIDYVLQQSQTKGTMHVLIDLDIDNLQIINDISGREAGDQVIRRVGGLIRHLVRNKDDVARLASDKFVVLLEDCPLRIAIDLAHKIRAAIQELVFAWEDESHKISVSVGIAPITPKTESVTAALNAVEAARNAAKERGRNQVKVFDQDDVDLMMRRDEMRWVGRIQNALANNRFALYAQLIKPLQKTEQNPHYEVLLRMLDDDDKIIPPGAFIPAAEHYSLMPDIDRWVIENTFKMLAGKPYRVSINLSGQSLCNDGFLEFVVKHLQSGIIDPQQVCFEVTETATIANLEEARILIAAIKSLGSSFSLDDFGTGLSSFNYLKNMQVDYLKIDGAFVRTIETDTVAEVMVKAIHDVGKAIGLKTIAEFVENDEITQRLISMGVDYGQGYCLEKPRPLLEILEQHADNSYPLQQIGS